ncbi:short chain dehydrogenase reductase [Niveomyces insectorum RCEF 264]|uniref:Short chain dehydrogenase reductase n=1 Tax=Niveomyces insectorum RCEF 264 TaxID=1081102 RepID=A0A167SPD7_9HYPO|nr:short chain dehydrogenase reductase [Niveomyces insectorum RCEF 264]
MVALSAAEATNLEIATTGTRPFVAVFIGGTAGIGLRGIQGLVSAHVRAGARSRGLRVYIVGRNADAASALIAESRAKLPKGTFTFVQAKDLGLLADVDSVCTAVIDAERAAAAKENHSPQIDLLVLTQGVVSFSKRKDTTEGIDHVTALVYYGRARAIDRLLPLLTDAAGGATSSHVGHVVAVVNPRLEGPLNADDLSLRDPKNFTFGQRSAHMALGTTLYLQALATRHPGRLAGVHYYPGVVMTDIFKSSPLPWWARWLTRLVTPLFYVLSVSDKECGERVAFLASTAHFPPKAAPNAKPAPSAANILGADGQPNSGAYRLNYDGEAIKTNKLVAEYEANGLLEKWYAHTTAAFAAVEAGRPFTE